jgi:hypothetical protein
LAVTWNFTIDDGLELELDNMMTSFVRSAPPSLCPYTDSVQLHSIDSLPLLACLPLLGVVVQMTHHWSNLASAVYKQNSLPTPTSLPVAVSTTALAFSSQAP